MPLSLLIKSVIYCISDFEGMSVRHVSQTVHRSQNRTHEVTTKCVPPRAVVEPEDRRRGVRSRPIICQLELELCAYQVLPLLVRCVAVGRCRPPLWR